MDSKEDWIHALNFCKVRRIPLYTLKWESKDTADVLAVGEGHLERSGIEEEAKTINTFSDIFKGDTINKAISLVQGATKEGVSVFKHARGNAKAAGKMLAHFLISGLVFDQNHTFSVMGFSLGSQVAKSCVNRLHKLGKTNTIHNIYFLAGATFIRKEKQLI